MSIPIDKKLGRMGENGHKKAPVYTEALWIELFHCTQINGYEVKYAVNFQGSASYFWHSLAIVSCDGVLPLRASPHGLVAPQVNALRAESFPAASKRL